MSENWDGSDSSHPRHAANARSSDGPSLEQRRAGDKSYRYWLALFAMLAVVALVVVALYFLVQPSGMTMTK
jgi:negative regulator of sigma E activity